MSSKLSVFIATSLDGFIARAGGEIDWLERANATVPSGEDCGYSQFMTTIDALVLGRASFEKVCSFPEWPYGQLPVYVLSSRLRQLPAGTPASVVLLNAEPTEVVRIIANVGHFNLYIDGGKTIQAFLSRRLISEITVTVIPVLLGGIVLYVGMYLLSQRVVMFVSIGVGMLIWLAALFWAVRLGPNRLMA